mgnify:CR=1 FL=1
MKQNDTKQNMAIAETRAPRAHLYTKQVLIALVATYLAALSLAIDIPKPSGDGEYVADQTDNMDDTTPRCDKLCNASCCFLNAPFVMCAKCDDNIECHPAAECFSEDDEKRKKIEDEQSAFQTVAGATSSSRWSASGRQCLSSTRILARATRRPAASSAAVWSWSCVARS